MVHLFSAGEELGHTAVAHINYLDKSKSSPLHLAVRGGNTDTISLCLATGAKVDQQQVPTAQTEHKKMVYTKSAFFITLQHVH